MRFEGEYLNGKRWNGKGYNNGKIEFEIKDGNGFMKEYYEDTLIFEGDYLNGERNGKGKEYSDYGDLWFEGEYLNGKRHGKRKEYYFTGELLFEGEYLYGQKKIGRKYKWGLLEYEG